MSNLITNPDTNSYFDYISEDWIEINNEKVTLEKTDEVYEIRILKKLIEKRIIDNITNCWNFQGTPNTKYGVISYKGKTVNVHRFIAFICLGLRLENRNLYACHKCDNTRCFNPEHIFIGTALDNQNDAIIKGRRKRKIIKHKLNYGKILC